MRDGGDDGCGRAQRMRAPLQPPLAQREGLDAGRLPLLHAHRGQHALRVRQAVVRVPALRSQAARSTAPHASHTCAPRMCPKNGVGYMSFVSSEEKGHCEL